VGAVVAPVIQKIVELFKKLNRNEQTVVENKGVPGWVWFLQGC
jgi:hypothetical protein